MSINPASLQQLQDKLADLSFIFSDVVDSVQALSIEAPVSWTTNSDARPATCHHCAYRDTCESYGDPALRRSVTGTGLGLSA